MKADAPAAPVVERGWWDTALGLARDAVPVASTVTAYSFAAAKRGSAAAAGISGAMISGGGTVASAGAAALGATGVVSAPVASRVGAGVRVGTAAAGLSVRSANAATAWGLSAAAAVASATLSTMEYALDAAGVSEGTSVRLAFGDDAGEALLSIQKIVGIVGMAPPDGMAWHDMAAAARALAWLQATGGGATPPPQEGATAAGARAAVHWAQVRRNLRFALAAYGHLALKLLGVLPRLGGPPRAQGNELHCILGRQPGDAVIMAARGCPEARVSHNARRGRAHNCGQRQVGARD
jgi:hypothetical protein